MTVGDDHVFNNLLFHPLRTANASAVFQCSEHRLSYGRDNNTTNINTRGCFFWDQLCALNEAQGHQKKDFQFWGKN